MQCAEERRAILKPAERMNGVICAGRQSAMGARKPEARIDRRATVAPASCAETILIFKAFPKDAACRPKPRR